MRRRQERRQAKEGRNLAAQEKPAEEDADPHLTAVRAALAKKLADKAAVERVDACERKKSILAHDIV